MEKDRLRFYYGIDTPSGSSVSLRQLANPSSGWRLFLLRGLPGWGCHKVLEALEEALAPREPHMELLLSAQHTGRLEALVLPGVRSVIADETVPHRWEDCPQMLTAVFSLSDAWNREQVFAHHQEILSRMDREERSRTLAAQYLGAADSLLRDAALLTAECIDQEKLRHFGDRLACRELPRAGGHRGSEEIRALSACTDRGFSYLKDTVPLLAQRVFLLEDGSGVCSRFLNTVLRRRALEAGCHVISCRSPFSASQAPEHLFLPELSLGFVTADHFLEPIPGAYRVIHAKRFLDWDRLRQYRKRLSFCRRAASQMMEQASRLLEEARDLHSQLEDLCRKGIIDRTEAVTAELLEHLERLSPR